MHAWASRIFRIAYLSVLNLSFALVVATMVQSASGGKCSVPPVLLQTVLVDASCSVRFCSTLHPQRRGDVCFRGLCPFLGQPDRAGAPRTALQRGCKINLQLPDGAAVERLILDVQGCQWNNGDPLILTAAKKDACEYKEVVLITGDPNGWRFIYGTRRYWPWRPEMGHEQLLVTSRDSRICRWRKKLYCVRLPPDVCVAINRYLGKSTGELWRVPEGGPTTYVFLGHKYAMGFLYGFDRSRHRGAISHLNGVPLLTMVEQAVEEGAAAASRWQ